MKKVLIFIVIIIILGIGSWLVLPFFIDKKVSEISPLVEDNPVNFEDSKDSTSPEDSKNTEDENIPKLVASGSFSGFDKIHYGSGTASLIQSETGYILRFEEDFDVANGPDLYVGLGKDGKYIEGSEISRLKGNKGSQNYVLPNDFDINTTNEIWIWCKAFSVSFAKVVLTSM